MLRAVEQRMPRWGHGQDAHATVRGHGQDARATVEFPGRGAGSVAVAVFLDVVLAQA